MFSYLTCSLFRPLSAWTHSMNSLNLWGKCSPDFHLQFPLPVRSGRRNKCRAFDCYYSESWRYSDSETRWSLKVLMVWTLIIWWIRLDNFTSWLLLGLLQSLNQPLKERQWEWMCPWTGVTFPSKSWKSHVFCANGKCSWVEEQGLLNGKLLTGFYFTRLFLLTNTKYVVNVCGNL